MMQTPFEQAVTEYGATVPRVCSAVLGPGADAEDAWSETFLAAMKAWPELVEDANVEAWPVKGLSLWGESKDLNAGGGVV